LKVSKGTVTSVSGGAIAVGALIFATMSFIAYRKRKVIEKSARRLSSTIVRASMSLRNSIRGIPGVDQTKNGKSKKDDDDKDDPFGIRAARDATNAEVSSSASDIIADNSSRKMIDGNENAPKIYSDKPFNIL
tara:strand:+ start:169 stop:567 length:399 start_codon:yes stop_codon:yes gene_type:complete